MDKKLVLISQTSNLYFPLECESCILCNLYNGNSLVKRVIRKLLLKFQLPGVSLFFDSWYIYLNRVNEVVIFDTGNGPLIVKWLNRHYPNLRIIFWYWNSVEDSVKPSDFSGLNVELWSFDIEDVKRYSLRKNTQFFIEDNLKRISSNSFEHADVFYVGVDKNRSRLLYELSNFFDKYGITYFYNLVKYRNSENSFGIEYKNPLEYPEVLTRCNDSKVIIDLVAEWQTGLTLRPLEAIYLKKKLITNMKNIDQFDFYNPNNIYIIGKRNREELLSFIQTPFDETDINKYKEYYSFKSWLHRFDE